MSVIFEIITLGGIKRVAAVDETTGIEVVIQVPAHLPTSDAQKLVLRKLTYRLQQEALTEEASESSATAQTTTEKGDLV